MADHIFVSNFCLRKAHDGSWFVSKVFTSVGNFDLGPEISANLDKNKLEAAINDIKNKIIPQIQKFICEEVSEEKKQKTKNG